MKIKDIETYKNLVSYLEEWKGMDEGYEYDSHGVMGLLEACLKNIDKYFIGGDFEEIKEFIGKQELDTIKEIAKHI